MMDDLQQAYSAYQNALVNLRNPKVSRLDISRFTLFATSRANSAIRTRGYGMA